MHDIDLMLRLQLEGRYQEAREISDKLEEIGPEKLTDINGKVTDDIWLRHSFNRGWYILQDGDYQSGSRLLEAGRYLNVYGSPPLRTPAPIYNPEEHDLKGKSIIISGEGGYGDEIIHARFVKSFKNLGAEKVYLTTVPELKSLFSRIEGVDGVVTRNEINTVPHDYWVPAFSAGWLAGHTHDNLPNDPYITPNFLSVDMWKSMIPKKEGKINVGIRWSGNPKFEHQQFRRFPEEFIVNLSKYEELEIYSLQRDHNLIKLPENVHDLQYMLISWEDTAAALANLDIVITSCTSIAHLAAAMGKETWVIVPILPYYIWSWKSPHSTTSPYYKTARIFRQQKPGKWNETFQELYGALEERFNLEHVDLPICDREFKKLNLGCGFKKHEGFINVDVDADVKPDEVVDLNSLPWKWEDDTFDHIIAKDILEHLGNSNEHFIEIIKEMYRVSNNGAVWEIEVPHWRCDTLLDDPTHKRTVTPGFWHLFNQESLKHKIMAGQGDSRLAFEHDVDLNLVDMQIEYIPKWTAALKSKEITTEELNYALNHYNNVAVSVKYLIQVHKPGRVSHEEYLQTLNSRD
jgi:hypothetical protein